MLYHVEMLYPIETLCYVVSWRRCWRKSRRLQDVWTPSLSAGLGGRNFSSSHGDIAKFRHRSSGLKGLKA